MVPVKLIVLLYLSQWQVRPNHAETTGKLSSDGVVIRDGGEVRALAGEWRVWVTIQVPRVPPSFRAEIRKMIWLVNSARVTRRPENSSNETLYVSQMVKASWLGRLQRIQQDFPPNTTTHEVSRRDKRGLLDAVGMLAHSLFGVATDGEIKEIQTATEKLSGDQAMLVHQMELLTTVVNRSRIYEEENREQVNELNRRFRRIQIFIPKLVSEVNYLTLLVQMERVMEDLEIKWDTLKRMQVLYAHRKQDLHSLKLTEELLPPRTLQKILSNAETSNMTPMKMMNWYYTYANVRPMWANPEHLVFEVKLKMVRPTQFLLYDISAWPVPVTATASATVETRGTFGYNTHNGELFTAQTCVGRRPRVCHADPIWGMASMPCVRGLLTGNHLLMELCAVKVEKGNQSRINHITSNEYVLSTWGEQVKLRCQGQPVEPIQFQRGVHRFNIQPHCNAYSQHWTIKGILMQNSSVVMKPKELPRSDPLRLPELFRTTIDQYRPEKFLSDLRPVATIPLALLRRPEMTPIQWTAMTHVSIWTVITFMLTLSAIVMFLCWYKGWCSRIRTRCRPGPREGVRKRQIPTSDEMESMGMLPETYNKMLESLEMGGPVKVRKVEAEAGSGEPSHLIVGY